MNKNRLIILLMITFFAGIAFTGVGYIGVKKSKPLVEKVLQKIRERRIASIPKAKEELVIIDFEDMRDVIKMDYDEASGELSNEHSTSGKMSLKMTYKPSNLASAVKLETYLENNKFINDWSRYEVLTFDIFNPYNETQRMILQIKDIKEGKDKIDLSLEPNANNHIEVDIRELWDKLRVTDIAQFNLFLWNNSSERTFYLDNLRLLPSASIGKQGKSILNEEFLPEEGEKIYATGDYFAFDKARWTKEEKIKFPLVEVNYSSFAFSDLPLNGGVPFPKGELNSLGSLALVDGQDTDIPFQARVLSRWPDKSIKWALFTLKDSLSEREGKKCYVKYGSGQKTEVVESSLKIEDGSGAVTVNTGPLKFSLSRDGFYLFDNIWLDKNSDGIFSDDEKVSSKSELVLAREGKEYFAHLDKDYELTIEEKGPIAACVKAKGWFVSANGEKFCQFVVRIYAYEGSGYLKVEHTFIYTGYPENKIHYLYQGKRLPKNETIEAVYLKTPLEIKNAKQFTFFADDKIMQGGLTNELKFLQRAHNVYDVFKDGKLINSGNQLQGWVDLSAQDCGISIGIKNFWRQYPKGFVIDSENNSIITHLWPKDAGELDLKTTDAANGPGAVARGSAFGLAKTHELYFYFHKGDYENAQVKNTMEGLLSERLLLPALDWISATRALGRIWPYDKRLAPGEEFLDRLFNWGERQIRNFNWYGMVNFGDTLSWYRKDAYDESYGEWGWHPVGRWGWFNCEGAGTHSGALIQFLRTGNLKYYIFGSNLARHIMDIDTCHYNTVANDKRLKGRIPDDYSRAGSMHRHNADHWGGRNEEASHTNVYGLLLYYYISGDERARDVIDEVGQFFLSERITYYKHPDIAPQRTLANILWGDVLLYEVTGEEKYKNAADKWAGLFYQGQKQNGAWGENYNPEKKRWDGDPHLGYMTGYTLPALIEYHKLTGNKAIAQCITKATDFIIKNSDYAGYFDASAYSYWLSAEKKYLESIKNRLDYSIGHQKIDGDPMMDGMIYQKATYGRVMEYLYEMPFAFEVLTNE